MNSRKTAAGIIGKWLDNGDFPDRLIGAAPDRAFVMEVVYGIARRHRTLEWIIAQCSSREPDSDVRPYLLVGAYQLFMMDNVADHAVLHETVNAAKSGPARPAAGFINAVLRKIQTDRDTLKKEIQNQPLGIRESHPDVIVERWSNAMGEAKTEELCRWNNSRPDVIIHVNRRKGTCESLLASLQSENIAAAPHPFAPDEFLVLPRGPRIQDLPGYEAGLFSVQDPSTLAPVNLLDVRPGQDVLDACAAPGGKTILIGEKMEGKGQITAMDIYEDRLGTLRENIKRMGLENVEIVRGNAALKEEIKQASPGRLFDRILIDVPCTNTGVLRRRPDARWRFSLERLEKVTEIQRLILDGTAPFLKQDGVFVYSTCSIEPEECGLQIESWLTQNAGFELVQTVSLFPPETGTDGIYAAAIRRIE